VGGCVAGGPVQSLFVACSMLFWDTFGRPLETSPGPHFPPPSSLNPGNGGSKPPFADWTGARRGRCVCSPGRGRAGPGGGGGETGPVVAEAPVRDLFTACCVLGPRSTGACPSDRRATELTAARGPGPSARAERADGFKRHALDRRRSRAERLLSSLMHDCGRRAGIWRVDRGVVVMKISGARTGGIEGRNPSMHCCRSPRARLDPPFPRTVGGNGVATKTDMATFLRIRLPSGRTIKGAIYNLQCMLPAMAY
jgi:hypothetical protein